MEGRRELCLVETENDEEEINERKSAQRTRVEAPAEISLHVIVRPRTPPLRIPALVFVLSKFKHSNKRNDVAPLVTSHKLFTRTYATVHSFRALVLLEHEGGVTEPGSLSALTY